MTCESSSKTQREVMAIVCCLRCRIISRVRISHTRTSPSSPPLTTNLRLWLTCRGGAAGCGVGARGEEAEEEAEEERRRGGGGWERRKRWGRSWGGAVPSGGGVHREGRHAAAVAVVDAP